MDNFYSYHNHKLSNRSSVTQAYHTGGDSFATTTAASLQQQVYTSPSPGVNLYNNAYNSHNSSQRNDGDVELQKRLSKARALNLLYKQQVAKNILSNNSTYGSSDMRGHEVGGSKPKRDEKVDDQHLLLSEVEHTEAASSMNHRNHDTRDIVDDKDVDNHHDHSIQTSSNPGRHPLNNSSDDHHHVDGVVRSNQTRNNGHDQQQPVPMTPHDNIINVSSGRRETSRSNTHDDTTSDTGDHRNRFRPYDHDSTSRRRNMNNQSSTTSSSSIRTGNSDSIGSKKSLHEATDKLKAAIEEHSIYLNKQVYERQEKEQKKKIERQRIDRILSSEVIHGKMPLWRHVLEGRHHPSKDTILRGVRLWRAITRVLIQIVCRPCLLILKNKLRIKAREMWDYSETLNIIAGSMDEWLSKLVQLPIASIVQEKGFQFDPEEVAFNAQPLRIRMLQLKVRFRAILLNIASSDMPSETITSFLSTLIEDGSYYGDILWPFEEKQLAFDSLSATRHLIIEVHHDHDDNYVSDLDGDDGDDVRDKHDDDGRSPSIDPSDLIELRLVDPTVTDTRTINIRRVRLILQDFIFIRVLINHLILSPWNYNICPKPKNRHTKRAITNYRIMASVVYEFLRSMDDNVPPIIQKVIPSKHNSFIHAGVSNVVSDADHGKNKSNGSMTMNAGIINSIESSTKAGEVGGVGGARPTGFMYRLSSLLGMSDTTPGEQVWSSDSIEMQLLGIRPTYTSLRHIHNRMYPTQALLPVKNLLSSWFSEVISPVKDYMNRLIVHVLKLKYTKMKKEEGMKEQRTTHKI